MKQRRLNVVLTAIAACGVVIACEQRPSPAPRPVGYTPPSTIIGPPQPDAGSKGRLYFADADGGTQFQVDNGTAWVNYGEAFGAPSGTGYVTTLSGNIVAASTPCTAGQFAMGNDAGVPGCFSMSSNLSCSTTNPGACTVSKIIGATVPAAGSLTTGNVLQVNGASSTTYAPINLAGGSNYVTGILPIANEDAPSGTGYAISAGGFFYATSISGVGGQLMTYNGSSFPVSSTMSGDCTMASNGTGVITCTKVNSTTGTGLLKAASGSVNTAALSCTTDQFYGCVANSPVTQTITGDTTFAGGVSTTSQINGSACTSAQFIENTGSALACSTMSGDCTLASNGAISCTKVHGTTGTGVVVASSGTVTAAALSGTGGQIASYTDAGAPQAVSMSGDCTMNSSGTGAITCTKVNGTTGTGLVSTTSGSVNTAALSCTTNQVYGCAANAPVAQTISGDFNLDGGVATVTAVQGKAYAAPTTQGDIAYYNGTSIARLGAGTAGYGLSTESTSANPVWAQHVAPSVCGIRLTTSTGVAVPTADQASIATLYATPYLGGSIALFTTALGVHIVNVTSDISVAVGTVTSGLPYDIFGYDNSGSLGLDAPLAWTSTTARATTVTYQNGFLAKNGDATRRYLGTFYSTSTTTTEDSYAHRYLYNWCNPVPRPMFVGQPSGSNWTYSSATVRQANATSTAGLFFVLGQPGMITSSIFATTGGSNASAEPTICHGLDSTTGCDGASVSSSTIGTPILTVTTTESINAAVGYHALNWLEACVNPGTCTFYHGSVSLSGMTGTVTL